MVCRKRRILKSYPDGEEDETGGRTSCQNLQLSKRNATLPDRCKYTFVSAYFMRESLMIHRFTARSDVYLRFSNKSGKAENENSSFQ